MICSVRRTDAFVYIKNWRLNTMRNDDDNNLFGLDDYQTEGGGEVDHENDNIFAIEEVDFAESDTNDDDVENSPEIAEQTAELTGEYLPNALLDYANDAAMRNCRAPEIGAFSLLILISALIEDKISIYPKQNDRSMIVPATLSCVIVTDPRRADSMRFEDILRLLMRASQNHFDFGRVVVERRRTFANGQIKFVKRGEIGDVEAIYTENSYGKTSEFVHSEFQRLFAPLSEKNLPNLIGKNNDTSQLNGFVLLNPVRRVWQFVDVEISDEIVDGVIRMLATLSKTIDALNSDTILHFDAAAQRVYNTFLTKIENLIDYSDEPSHVVSYVGRFRSLFPSLALIFYLADCAEKGLTIDSSSKVDLIAARRASAWCTLIDMQAREVFEQIFAENSTENLILEKIREGRLQTVFSLRELTRPKWTGLKSRDNNFVALMRMVENGLLAIEMTRTSNKGGSSRMRFRVVESLPKPLDAENEQPGQYT